MVEVEVAYCGICGSDVAEYAHGPYAIRQRPHVLSGQEPPLTLGHELSGRVVAVGEGVQRPAVGDRVSADACWRCETCEACRSGRYNQCAASGSIGLCSDGAFAARVRFPAYCAVPLPGGVSDRAGALLEPLAVGLHALDRAVARAAETVVVLGFGAIGACTAEVASALGLSVVVVEPDARRRSFAEELGYAAHAPEGEPRDVARAVRALTGGGADLVVDASGAPAALAGALEMTVRGGRIALVGIPKRPVDVDVGRLVLYERSLVASLGYANDLPRAAALIAAGTLRPERLITREVPLSEAPDALRMLADGATGDVKVLVDLAA